MVHRYIVENTTMRGDILSLTLAPKGPRYRLDFAPGQYVSIGFRRNGRPTPMRCFSIVSSPSSSKLQLGIRVQGNFTSAAAQLQPGDVVRVQGPFGKFNINSTYDRKVVMLAAGIGITPYISMLRHLTEQHSSIPIVLLYSNRYPDNIPFQDELVELEQRNPQLTIRLFISGSLASPQNLAANVIQSRITERHIAKVAASPYYQDSTFFICGPGGFIESMHASLLGNQIDEGKVMSESFAQAAAPSDSRLNIRTLTYGLSAAALVIATGGIMLLDISRLSPAANATNAVKQATIAAPSTSNPSSSSSSQSPDNSSASTSSNNTSDTTAATPSQTTQYQTPVSSVS